MRYFFLPLVVLGLISGYCAENPAFIIKTNYTTNLVPLYTITFPAETVSAPRPTAVPLPPLPPATTAKAAPKAAPKVVGPPNFGTLTLAWDYPPEELSTNISFLVFEGVNADAPMTNWVVFTNTPYQQTILPIVPGLHLYCVVATNNLDGNYSDRSLILPRAPISPYGISISK